MTFNLQNCGMRLEVWPGLSFRSPGDPTSSQRRCVRGFEDSAPATLRFMFNMICVAALGGIAIAGEPWPRFRGPNGTGISPDKGVPVRWDVDNGLAWKTSIPGTGNS